MARTFIVVLLFNMLFLAAILSVFLVSDEFGFDSGWLAANSEIAALTMYVLFYLSFAARLRPRFPLLASVVSIFFGCVVHFLAHCQWYNDCL